MTENTRTEYVIRYRHPHPLAGNDTVKAQRYASEAELLTRIGALIRDYPEHPIEVTQLTTTTRTTCLHNGSPAYYPSTS